MPPTAQRWDRLLVYSPYVRVVRLYEQDLPLLRHVRPFRPMAYLFANSVTLDCSMMSTQGLIFPCLMPPCLTHLILSIFMLPSLLQSLPRPFPPGVLKLQIIEFTFASDESEDTAKAEEAFGKLLTICSNTLKCLRIPETFATKTICTMLSQLPHLSRLVITDSVKYRPQPFSTSYKYEYGLGGFDCLEQFSFCGCQENLYNLLDWFDFSSVTQLHLTLETKDQELELDHRLTTSVISRFPKMEVLEVGEPRNPILPVVPWSAVRRLRDCPSLSTLLLHQCEAPEAVEDLVQLLASRTTWDKIILHTLEPLKIGAMLIFAKYCPRLTSLGICIDVGYFARPFPKIQPGLSFPMLEEIDFGRSRFSFGHTNDITEFLFEICDKPPTLRGTCAKFWDCVGRSMITYSNTNPQGVSAEKLRLFQNTIYDSIYGEELDLEAYDYWFEVQFERVLSGPSTEEVG